MCPFFWWRWLIWPSFHRYIILFWTFTKTGFSGWKKTFGAVPKILSPGCQQNGAEDELLRVGQHGLRHARRGLNHQRSGGRTVGRLRPRPGWLVMDQLGPWSKTALRLVGSSDLLFYWKFMHLGRLTWNLRIHPRKRKIIFQTIIFRFYVSLRECITSTSFLLT